MYPNDDVEIVHITRRADDNTGKLYMLPFVFKKRVEHALLVAPPEIVPDVTPTVPTVDDVAAKEIEEQKSTSEDSPDTGKVFDRIARPRFGYVTKDLLHQRFNHVGDKYLSVIAPDIKGKHCWCDACVVGGLPCRKFIKKQLKPSKDSREVSTEDLATGDAQESKLLAGEDEVVDLLSEIMKFSYYPAGKVCEDFYKYAAADTKVSPATSVRNYKYGTLVVCKSTGVVTPFLGVTKQDFSQKFRHWAENFRNVHNRYPAGLHMDKGGEFTDRDFIKWLGERGIDVTFAR